MARRIFEGRAVPHAGSHRRHQPPSTKGVLMRPSDRLSVGQRVEVSVARQLWPGTVIKIGRVLVTVRLDDVIELPDWAGGGWVSEVDRHEHEVYDPPEPEEQGSGK